MAVSLLIRHHKKQFGEMRTFLARSQQIARIYVPTPKEFVLAPRALRALADVARLWLFSATIPAVPYSPPHKCSAGPSSHRGNTPASRHTAASPASKGHTVTKHKCERKEGGYDQLYIHQLEHPHHNTHCLTGTLSLSLLTDLRSLLAPPDADFRLDPLARRGIGAVVVGGEVAAASESSMAARALESTVCMPRARRR